MPKTDFTQYDKDPANNTDIDGVDIAEGCAPSGINNAIRSVMSHIAEMNDGTVAMTSPDINGGTIDGATIGGGTAGAGTFTSATVTGDLTVDTDTLYVDSTNNRVGIGTSSPDVALHVYDATAGNARAIIGSETTFTNPYDGFQTGVAALQIHSSATAGGILNTSIDLTSSDAFLGGWNGIVPGTSGSEKRATAIYSQLDADSSTAVSGRLAFFTANAGTMSERMRIASDGIGIGTTNTSPSAGISGVVNFNGSGSGYELHLTDSGSGSTASDGCLFSWNNPNQYVFNREDGPIIFGTNNTERMRIASNGQLFLFNQTSGAGNATLKYTTGTGAVTYDTSSRLVKENIVDCPYGLAEIVQLQPRKYFRIDDQANEVGLIADEVQSIMPEFVPTGEKSLITGVEEDTEIIALGVNYDKMVAPLVQAIKDLNAKIETLEEKVAALENA